ncbi:hypothetical protein [Paraburkholderia sp. SIMBA_054]|uniref:hypothetical protein n=1 Tax=Paraburkholderia sp. SIMBA_054 TaxID=3085795 RepID=UPI00397A09D2
MALGFLPFSGEMPPTVSGTRYTHLDAPHAILKKAALASVTGELPRHQGLWHTGPKGIFGKRHIVKAGIVRLAGKSTWRYWVDFSNGEVGLSIECPNRAMALKGFRQFLNA